MTTRIVDPWRVFHAFGAWYLAAWCHRATAERLFRVDRVRAVRATGEHFELPERPAAEPDDGAVDAAELVYRPRPDDLRVTLRLAPAADWVVESYPHEAAEQSADGSWRVVLAVSEPAWLERLLLALGPDAAVEAPAGRHADRARRGRADPRALPVTRSPRAGAGPRVRSRRARAR